MVVQAKFYGKNVNDGPFANYNYIGSLTVDSCDTREQLIRYGEAIGGPVSGPMLALIDGDIRVLKV